MSDVKPMPKRAPMERILALEQSLERAEEGLTREIQARDEFRQNYENMRAQAFRNEKELEHLRAKAQGLEDSYTALNIECHTFRTEARVLREMLDRVMPAKGEKS